MRLFCSVLCLCVVSGTAASASSFVTLPAETATISRSMVFFGTPAPATPRADGADLQEVVETVALNYPAPIGLRGDPTTEAGSPRALFPDPFTQISPSVIALGEPAQEVENMEVAAIGAKTPATRGPRFAPMVIRGGITGDAFQSVQPAIADPGMSPAPVQVSSPPTRNSPGPAAPEPMPTPAPPPPAPAAQTRLPE